MRDKLKHLVLPAGVILLALAVISEKYLPSGDTLDFFIGMMYGMSIVFNIAGISIAALNISAPEHC